MSSDSEEEVRAPPPPKRPRKTRNPRRPNNGERLNRLEEMLEKIINQSNLIIPPCGNETELVTSAPPQQEHNSQDVRITAGNQNVDILAPHNMPHQTTLNYSCPVPTASNHGDTNSCVTSDPVRINVQIPSISGAINEISPTISQSCKPIDCNNTMRFIGKPENIPKFDGCTNTLSVHAWLHRLESLARIYGWDEKNLNLPHDRQPGRQRITMVWSSRGHRYRLARLEEAACGLLSR